MPISQKTAEYREKLDRTMLCAAYRQQLETIRNGLIARSAALSDESLRQCIDLLDEAGLQLTSYIERNV